MSEAIDSHSSSAAVVSGSSQSMSRCHSFSIKILAFTVTGDKTLIGSTTSDVSRKALSLGYGESEWDSSE